MYFRLILILSLGLVGFGRGASGASTGDGEKDGDRKVNEKFIDALDADEGSTDEFSLLSASVTRACYLYTYTYSNEALCNEIQSIPSVTYGCYKYSYTISNEADCLRWQVPPAEAYTCYRYTSTVSGERNCFWNNRTR